MKHKEKTIELCLQHPAAHVDRRINDLAQTLMTSKI